MPQAVQMKRGMVTFHYYRRRALCWFRCLLQSVVWLRPVHSIRLSNSQRSGAGATGEKSVRVDQMPWHMFIAIFAAAGILAGQCPAGAQTFSTYRCGDGSEFIAAFYEGDSRAHLQLDGKAVTLPKRLSVSGSRYAKGGITLRVTKTATTLKRGRRSTECKAQ